MDAGKVPGLTRAPARRARTWPRRSPRPPLSLVAVEETEVADDTSTRTFGATIRRHRLPRVVEGCKTGLDKRVPLLAVAHRCCVLRPGWCQQWCQTASLTTA